MCGIFGILQPRGDIDPGIAAMNAQLAHRGPDGEGIERLGGAVFGHRRLSIIDLTPTGAQPMWDVQHKVCITFNGEIYNYPELREECRAAGLEFRGTSDTEVIANLFLLHGERAFARLNGMFAFCLMDQRSGDSWLVRDPAGIKPLYFAETPAGLAFASELGALIASGWIPFEVDPEALQAYLQLDFVPSPMSMLAGVRKLPGGGLLHRDSSGAVAIRRFSEVLGASTPAAATPQEDLGRFRKLITDVVTRQMIADVPVGVFLSGGIDSSIVAAVAREVKGRLGTFSIAFEDPSFDERPFFDEVARVIGSDHHTETLTSSVMAELMPRVAEIVSEPLADGSIFPTYFLARFTRGHVKVVLSGDGADELFAGYPTYGVSRTGTRMARLPRPLLDAARGAAHALLPVSRANFAFDFKVKKFIEGLDRDPIVQNQRWMSSFQVEDLPGLLEHFEPRYQEGLVGTFHEAAREAGPGRPLEALLQTDRRFYLQDGVLVKADRASMASSLEVRVPFLDNEMIAYANGLPADRKIRGGESKWILRQYARERFSPAIWRRPKKGFGAPLAKWFRGELRDFVRDTLHPDRIARDGLFRAAAVSQIVDEHERGSRDHRKRLFNLMMFTMWHDYARRARA